MLVWGVGKVIELEYESVLKWNLKDEKETAATYNFFLIFSSDSFLILTCSSTLAFLKASDSLIGLNPVQYRVRRALCLACCALLMAL